jgi:hypothetical protein
MPLTGVSLRGVHLTDVHLTDVYHRRASHRRTSHRSMYFAELYLWRVSGPSIWLSFLISAYFRPLEKRFWKSTRSYTTTFGIFNVILAIYVIARGFIVVESFLSLRSMPIGVYEQVDWIALLPHL